MTSIFSLIYFCIPLGSRETEKPQDEESCSQVNKDQEKAQRENSSSELTNDQEKAQQEDSSRHFTQNCMKSSPPQFTAPRKPMTQIAEIYKQSSHSSTAALPVAASKGSLKCKKKSLPPTASNRSGDHTIPSILSKSKSKPSTVRRNVVQPSYMRDVQSIVPPVITQKQPLLKDVKMPSKEQNNLMSSKDSSVASSTPSSRPDPFSNTNSTAPTKSLQDNNKPANPDEQDTHHGRAASPTISTSSSRGNSPEPKKRTAISFEKYKIRRGMPTSHPNSAASSRANSPAKVIPTLESLTEKIEEAKKQKTKITPSLPVLKLPGEEVPLAGSKQQGSSQKSTVSVTAFHQNQVKTEGSSSQANTEVVDMELDSDTEQEQSVICSNQLHTSRQPQSPAQTTIPHRQSSHHLRPKTTPKHRSSQTVLIDALPMQNGKQQRKRKGSQETCLQQDTAKRPNVTEQVTIDNTDHHHPSNQPRKTSPQIREEKKEILLHIPEFDKTDPFASITIKELSPSKPASQSPVPKKPVTKTAFPGASSATTGSVKKSDFGPAVKPGDSLLKNLSIFKPTAAKKAIDVDKPAGLSISAVRPNAAATPKNISHPKSILKSVPGLVANETVCGTAIPVSRVNKSMLTPVAANRSTAAAKVSASLPNGNVRNISHPPNLLRVKNSQSKQVFLVEKSNLAIAGLTDVSTTKASTVSSTMTAAPVITRTSATALCTTTKATSVIPGMTRVAPTSAASAVLTGTKGASKASFVSTGWNAVQTSPILPSVALGPAITLPSGVAPHQAVAVRLARGSHMPVSIRPVKTTTSRVTGTKKTVVSGQTIVQTPAIPPLPAQQGTVTKKVNPQAMAAPSHPLAIHLTTPRQVTNKVVPQASATMHQVRCIRPLSTGTMLHVRDSIPQGTGSTQLVRATTMSQTTGTVPQAPSTMLKVRSPIPQAAGLTQLVRATAMSQTTGTVPQAPITMLKVRSPIPQATGLTQLVRGTTPQTIFTIPETSGKLLHVTGMPSQATGATPVVFATSCQATGTGTPQISCTDKSVRMQQVKAMPTESGHAPSIAARKSTQLKDSHSKSCKTTKKKDRAAKRKVDEEMIDRLPSYCKSNIDDSAAFVLPLGTKLSDVTDVMHKAFKRDPSPDHSDPMMDKIPAYCNNFTNNTTYDDGDNDGTSTIEDGQIIEDVDQDSVDDMMFCTKEEEYGPFPRPVPFSRDQQEERSRSGSHHRRSTSRSSE